MSLTAEERETIVGMCDARDVAEVWTSQRRVITRLRRNPAAELTGEGEFEGTSWATFRIPARLVSFRAPRGKASPEAAAQRRAALSRAHAARKTTGTMQESGDE
jgi:hypothetical protein